MNKSLLALAVLGAFAGVASAQSSVTIYGVLDMGIQKSNGGSAPSDGPGLSKAWTVASSTASRLGFRGNEDMGGGLSAQFQIEHRFNPDTGFANAIFWQGRSFVQLTSAAIGSVYLGRDYTPAFWPAVKSDPFGWNGVGQVGTAGFAGYLTPGTGAVRTDNTVGVKSASFGGLTVQAAVGLSEASGPGRNQGFNVEYAGGPLYAALGYEKISKGSNDGTGVTNFALHYDFGFVKAIGYYAQSKTNTFGPLVTNKMFNLGATAPLGSGLVKAMYFRVDPAGPDNNLSKFGLGYDYQLSKRTGLYADLGISRGGKLLGDPLDNPLNKRYTNNNTYAFGVVHTF